MHTFIKISTSLWLLLFCLSPSAQEAKAPSLKNFSDGIHHWNLFNKHDNYKRYASENFVAIANNLLQYQNSDGGWPKNIDWLAIINVDSVKQNLSERNRTSTLDNNNTFSQIEYLAEVYYLSKDIKYRESVQNGITYLLKNQNKSGGWRGWDTDAITYNDQIMTGVMNLFLDIIENTQLYDWMSDKEKALIKASLNRAITVTLQCQIVVNGHKTAWCQQHSHQTLEPVMARSFELASITARESTDVIEFLMRIKNPNDSIKEAITASINWLNKSALHGIRIKKVPLPDSLIINQEYPYDLVVVSDSTAKPIWARFYNIETNQPFMCKRNGTIVYQLSDVDAERRTGYAWYGYWPEETFKKYKNWLQTNKSN